MRFIDAHIHLSDPEYASKISEIVEEARRSSVIALVSNSMNLETSLRSLRLAEEHSGLVYAALGIHPWNIKDLANNELEQTLNLITQQRTRPDKVVAVGEIGLDPQHAKKRELKESQLRVFQEMLRAAEKASLPVIVHSRWTAPRIFGILPSYNLRAVLFHWFSSPIELLPQLVERGYYISEGPPSVFSPRIREIIEETPITSLLTETDGPVRYWGQPFKDKTTTPAFIPRVVQAIAEIKKMNEAEVAEQVLNNFTNFFKVSPRPSASDKRHGEMQHKYHDRINVNENRN